MENRKLLVGIDFIAYIFFFNFIVTGGIWGVCYSIFEWYPHLFEGAVVYQGGIFGGEVDVRTHVLRTVGGLCVVFLISCVLANIVHKRICLKRDFVYRGVISELAELAVHSKELRGFISFSSYFMIGFAVLGVVVGAFMAWGLTGLMEGYPDERMIFFIIGSVMGFYSLLFIVMMIWGKLRFHRDLKKVSDLR